MISILLGSVLGVIVSIILLVMNSSKIDGDEKWAAWIVFPLIGCLLGIMIPGMVVATAIRDTITYEWQTTEINELKQLSLQDRLEGSFFIGCGNINENDYFYYYEHNTKNGYTTLKRQVVANCLIVEDDKKIIEIQTTIPDSRSQKLLPFSMGSRKYVRYILHIPVNSIKRDFTGINLK